MTTLRTQSPGRLLPPTETAAGKPVIIQRMRQLLEVAVDEVERQKRFVGPERMLQSRTEAIESRYPDR